MIFLYGCFLKWWVSPISHPKMIIFSRKTHGCWGNPPFKETPIYSMIPPGQNIYLPRIFIQIHLDPEYILTWISRKHGRLGQTSFYTYDFFIPQNHLFPWPPTSTIFMMFCSLMAPMPSNTPPAAEWISILDFQLLFHDEVLEWCPATLNLGWPETQRFWGIGDEIYLPQTYRIIHSTWGTVNNLSDECMVSNTNMFTWWWEQYSKQMNHQCLQTLQKPSGHL